MNEIKETLKGDALDIFADDASVDKPEGKREITFIENEIDFNSDATEKKGDPIAVSDNSAHLSATVVVEIIDSVVPNIIASAIKLNKDETEYLHCDDRTKDEYIDVWSKYLKSKGGELSPSVMLLLMTASIYGGKIPVAVRMKKERLANPIESNHETTKAKTS